MVFVRRFAITALMLLTIAQTTWAGPQKPATHVVQEGQTLAKIAKRYQVTLEDLCDANSLKRSATLKPGMRLNIPGDEPDVETPATKTNRRDANARPVVTSERTEPIAQKAHQGKQASYSPYLAPPVKRGWVHLMGHHGEFKGQLVTRSGKLQTKSIIAISKVLAWPRTDFLMDRRLLMLLAKVSDAFGGRTLRAVSGYRTTSYSSESKHPLGRACDFHVLGVPNTALRDYVRTFNDVGVGYYPNSTFVHLDSRDYDAYWVDYAGPGEPPRYASDSASRRAERAAIGLRRAGESHEHGTQDPERDADEASVGLAPNRTGTSTAIAAASVHAKGELEDSAGESASSKRGPLEGSSAQAEAAQAATASGDVTAAE